MRRPYDDRQTGATLHAIQAGPWPGLRRLAVAAWATGFLLVVHGQPGPTPPALQRGPEGLAVQAGDTIRLGAVVTGDAPLSYKWTSDAGFVAHTSIPTLVISNAQPSHSGIYVLEATNTAGVARSRGFVITVQTNPLPQMPWLWQRLPSPQLSAPDDQAFGDVAVDRNGNTVVVGSARTSTPTEDWLIQVYAPDGRPMWSRTFNWGASSGNRATAVATDDAGNVYVTGTAWIAKGEGGDQDYVTMKLDPNGEVRWEAVFDGTTPSRGWANDLAVDSTGAVYVTGDSGTVKYGSDGEMQWYSAESSWRILLTPGEQSLFLMGMQQTNIVLLTTGGGTRWSKPLVGVGDIGVDSEGNLLACAATNLSFPSRTGDCLTVKFNQDGTMLWSTVFDSPQGSIDQPTSLAVCPDGSVVVAGGSRASVGALRGTFLLRYTASGTQEWTVIGTRPDADQYPSRVVVDMHGYVYMCSELGFSPDPSKGRQGILTKVRWDGAVLWSAGLSTHPEAATYFAGLAIDEAGTVAVGGTAPTVRRGDNGVRDSMLVLRFDPSTPQLFCARQNVATGFEGVAVGPTGKTFDITASKDLQQWAQVATVTNLNGVVAFRDEPIPGTGQTFYRAQDAR